MNRMTGRGVPLVALLLCGSRIGCLVGLVGALAAPPEATAEAIFVATATSQGLPQLAKGAVPVEAQSFGGSVAPIPSTTSASALASRGLLAVQSFARAGVINAFDLPFAQIVAGSGATFAIDDFVIVAPPGRTTPVGGVLRLHVEGLIDAGDITGGVRALTTFRMFVQFEGFTEGAAFEVSSFAPNEGPHLFGSAGFLNTPFPTAADLQQGGLVSIPYSNLPVNTPLGLSVTIAATTLLQTPPTEFPNPVTFSADSRADFFHTVRFPSTGPVLELPEGLTVHSPSLMIVDNRWLGAAGSPPIANAGPDQTKAEGSVVALDGTGSTDPDGDPLTYAWTQVDGPMATLSDPQAAAPTFIAPPVDGGGATLVFELTVGDPSGATVADQVAILVQNANDPPSCATARASHSILWPPNHAFVPVGVTGVSDPENGTVTITVTGVTQDEPVGGPDQHHPDALLQGAAAALRAERDGSGNGRVYRVSFLADDGQGGSCTGEVVVAVPHSLNPNHQAIDDGQLYDATQP